jgi:uncharacterized protein (DUF885 family)
MLKKTAVAMARSSAVATVLVAVGVISGEAAAADAPTPSAQVITLANRLAALRVNYDPTIAYVTGLPAPSHSRFPDRSLRAIRALERDEDAISAALARVPAGGLDAKANATRAVLKEMLEASRQLRVCRAELWDLSHFTGWQVGFALVAELQPVGTPALRAEALKRWGSLPGFLRVQTANLRAGLAAGYSVPKSVVNRVITQLDALVASAPEESPFYSLAMRDGDAAFSAKLKSLIGEKINPAIRDFRVFLAKDYLPHARDTLALSALPDGAQCYQAQLRSYTTLDRTPAEVMALGEKTVKENEQTVIALGSKLYGTSDVVEIIKRNNDAADNHFGSPDELLASARALLSVAVEKSRPYFVKLPDQSVVVEPPPAYQQGTGISAHYEPQPDLTKAARYIEPTEEWKSQTRGLGEITLVHEAIPGHHLQIALAFESPQGSDLAKLADNSAYVEGWARYAERLSEEAGTYRTDYARISRRIWPARGMVVDPGLHAFGWSREEAVTYLVATGRFDERGAEATVDRIATIPGQLTAYDSGGLEIFALRTEAEAALGSRFDIRQFHQRVLEQGIVPLQELRDHVRAWIAEQKR